MDHEALHKRMPDIAGFNDTEVCVKRPRIAYEDAFLSPITHAPFADVNDDCNDFPKQSYIDVGFSHVDGMCIDAVAQSPNPEIICYGALCDAKVRLNASFISKISATTTWNQFCEFELFLKGSYYYLKGTGDGDDIGILDLVSTNTLKLLHELPGMTQTVILALHKLTKLAKNKVRKPTIVDASINLLGPRNLFEKMGDAITNANGHLQHPYYLTPDVEYINPHYFYPHNIRTDLRHLIGPVAEDSKDMRLAQGLGEIFNDLPPSRDSDLSCIDLLEEAHAEGLIVTPLKKHQEQGVKSILAREDYGQAISATQLLEGAIGYNAFANRSAPLLGGIDADVMGLGKTLTMLSAMVCSMKTAIEFTTCYDEGTTHPIATRATLVVATSSQVIEVWRSEIERHLKPGLLRLCVFHGSGRAKTAEDIVDNDIVLTTYNTLVSDRKSSKLLQRLTWFRVVLDEAHWIRNSTSQQFKAACNLEASRRWCLTGTPIQNSLDDLRSLLAFLHFHPFSEPAFFRKHIIEPLSKESPDQFRNLRLLLRLVCFRRTAELLSLPPYATEEVTITLTDREAQLYEDMLAACKKEFDEIANMKSSKKKYCVLFATIMKLRRLCNHGTFQRGNPTLEVRKSSSRNKKLNEKEPHSLEEISCAYCYGDNADIGVTSDTLQVCPGCSRVFDYGPKTTVGSVSPTPSTNPRRDAVSPGQRFDEPPFSMIGVDSQPTEDMGFSSKLNAVVDNIQRSPATSKSLVFTSWRVTLDILQRLLSYQCIQCLRIDGQTSFSDRQSILTRFCEDPTQNVLLLSIATGAVGLTLTVADRVHIVEPQWNPMVEEQAIGRALRIGQNRCVTIFKYITKSTNIMSRQKRKNHLAMISLDGHSDHAEERLEDLMFILQRNAS
ncbi:SNF2 family N-terminal domain-containing protein [Xylaria acuta]|nr:SNF2 family N-terminal domain-containing protein [Xylaria acuta]